MQFSENVANAKGDTSIMPKCKKCNQYGHAEKKCPIIAQEIRERKKAQKRNRVPSSSDSITSEDSVGGASSKFDANGDFKKPPLGPIRRGRSKKLIIENSVYKPPLVNADASNGVYNPASGGASVYKPPPPAVGSWLERTFREVTD